jgi:type IX secretion system PorP/SprF family membrane protein
MDKKLKNILFYIYICCSVNTVTAQDAIFSQYFTAGLYTNPAYVCIEKNPTLIINNRIQWKTVSVPYSTNQISLFFPFGRGVDTKFYIGASIYNHLAGEVGLKTTSGSMTFGYNAILSELHRMQGGIQLGVIQKQIDFSNGQWGSQFDPLNGWNSNLPSNETFGNNSSLYPDVSLGVNYTFNEIRDQRQNGFDFNTGFSVYHLNQPNESVIESSTSKLPMLFKGVVGFNYTINEHFLISPNVMFAKQSTSFQSNIGLYANYFFGKEVQGFSLVPNKLLIGSWYRLKDSFIAGLGIGNDTYMIVFTYDINQSNLRKSIKGLSAYEISLKFSLGKKTKYVRANSGSRF